MDTKVLQRFREQLHSHRHNLIDWLKGTPPEKKQINFGPLSENDVQSRIDKFDDALAKADQNKLGLCEVCHEYIETDRLEMDFTACVCLDHYSEEQKRGLEQELELSHKVHKALLPKELPKIPGMEVAAFSRPAELVGGDYFDFFTFRDGTYGFAIADVMGKGLPASMLMASLQASLRILFPENNSPAQVIGRLNSLFCHNIHLIRFITIVLGRYNPETGILVYANAGHNPPFLFRGATDRSVIKLRPTGAAIGLTESSTFEEAQVQLQKGDSLLLYTDGATEAGDPGIDEFGEERLEEWMVKHAQLPPKALIKELWRALRTFTRSNVLRDDLTLIAAKLT